MKLQLSLDKVNLDEALVIIEETKQSVDILEVGTPLALKYGVKAISLLKQTYPAKEVLADYKIIDGGQYEASMAFEAGADIVTVLGVASDLTIAGTIIAARDYRRKVMVDLIGIMNIWERIPSIEILGVDFICIHTALDVQNSTENPIAQFISVKQIVKTTRLAIAGGLNIRNIGDIVPYKPDIVIVGAGITAELDRAKAASEIKQRFIEANHES